ncbi:MAG: DUF362 domain-containing protein [Planctomycetes bacterium]|nr:DUF362 domain-containing protein [Planctomycetota bacterium]MBM4079539.1 DUF362 domain-containing protein [Planctomycetota bacterium]MBM4083270.1 DUF362 domain-containing protein [Planctomycetota bacterium]
MEATKSEVTRRDFFTGAAYGTLGLALGLKGLPRRAGAAEPFAAEKPVSTVVLVRNEAAVGPDHQINAKVVAEMLDAAVTAFSGEADALKAWKRYFRPDDTVGIKFTRCGWMTVPTEPEVTEAIAARLRDAGVPAARIHVKDYGMPLKECTALVNVPSIKAHTLTGIAVSVKNYICFASGKLERYHGDGSAKLGETWLLPDVKGKTRLVIVDALRPYFGPGPQLNPLHRWDYKGLLVGTDPVAVDTVCLRLCQVKRNLFKGEEWPLSPPAKSIAAADTEYHLGTSDPTKIKLVKLGWSDGVLI